MNGARRYAILAPHAFGSRSAKTAHGVIAYAADRTVAVIDPDLAGRRVDEVAPHLNYPIPIVGTLSAALSVGPTSLLIGIAPAGGAMTTEIRATVAEALDAGLEVVSGLHQFIADDLTLANAATTSGARIWDVRRPPTQRLFDGSAYDVPARVVLTVGSDAAVGKMTASLELVREARERAYDARFVATGQTGIMIAGRGTAIDGVVCDFATGAAEELVLADGDAQVLFVEGQGAINHPAFAPVTLALLFGSAPDALVLVHDANRSSIESLGTPLLSLADCVARYEDLCATVKPARVAAIAINTAGLADDAARAAIERVERETRLPCEDLVRSSGGRVLEAVLAAIETKGRPLA